MTNYWGYKYLLKQLKVLNFTPKYSFDSSGWLMVEYMHNEMLNNTQKFVKATNYITISCDEMTFINNHTYGFVNVYVV